MGLYEIRRLHSPPMEPHINPWDLVSFNDTDAILDRIPGLATQALEHRIGMLGTDAEAGMHATVAEEHLPHLVLAFVSGASRNLMSWMLCLTGCNQECFLAYNGAEDALSPRVAQVETILAQFEDGQALIAPFRARIEGVRRNHRALVLGLEVASARLEVYVLKRIRSLAMNNAGGVDAETFRMLHDALVVAYRNIRDVEGQQRRLDAVLAATGAIVG